MSATRTFCTDGRQVDSSLIICLLIWPFFFIGLKAHLAVQTCIEILNSLRVPTWISLDIYTHCTLINFTDVPFFKKTKRIKKRCVTHHLDCVRICEVKPASPTLRFYSRILKFSVLSAMADAIPKTGKCKAILQQ